MNRLIDDEIFQLLESAEMNNNLNETALLTLKETFETFRIKLLNFSIVEKDLPFCYRSLRELELKLTRFENVLAQRENTVLNHEKQEIVRKLSALSLIEKEMFQLRLERPEQFRPTCMKHISVLKWKGSLSDLMELIISFTGTGIISTTTGENLTHALLIQSFESLFNVRFGRSNDQKAAVFRRKKNCACLLDRLRDNLEMKVNDYYAK